MDVCAGQPPNLEAFKRVLQLHGRALLARADRTVRAWERVARALREIAAHFHDVHRAGEEVSHCMHDVEPYSPADNEHVSRALQLPELDGPTRSLLERVQQWYQRVHRQCQNYMYGKNPFGVEILNHLDYIPNSDNNNELNAAAQNRHLMRRHWRDFRHAERDTVATLGALLRRASDDYYRRIMDALCERQRAAAQRIQNVFKDRYWRPGGAGHAAAMSRLGAAAGDGGGGGQKRSRNAAGL